jgi:flagellar hook-associated protein 3 FlgL
MTMTSVGDRSLQFNTMRATTQIKTRLSILTEEMSSGVAHDLTGHLRGDTARLADVDRRLNLISGFSSTATEAGQTLAAMQTTLQGVEGIRSQLAAQLVALPSSAMPNHISNAIGSGRGAFDSIVRAMNTTLGNRSLFAGAATDTIPLAEPDAMITSLSAAVAGSVTANDVQTAIDTWFDSPTGGFATMAYQGDTGPVLSRRVDMDTSVQLDGRADDPAIKALLKAAATAAMAGDAGLVLSDTVKSDLLRSAGLQMLSAAQPLVNIQARLGIAEETVETTTVRQAAQKTAYGIMRNDLVSADPYDTAAELQQVQKQLETHYTLTARLSNLSLVEYI